MLTLKQIQKEAKARNVSLDYDGGSYDDFVFVLREDANDDKEFQTFKEEFIQRHHEREKIRKNNHQQLAKQYPKNKWHQRPFEASPVPDDEYIRKEFAYRDEDNPTSLAFREDQSAFSCAIQEFGDFNLVPRLNKHWDLLLQYYVRKSHHKYFKCAVPSQKEWSALNDGLKKAGFEKRASEKSNHGRYVVHVWEYIKK